VIFPNYIFRLEVVCLKAYSILFFIEENYYVIYYRKKINMTFWNYIFMVGKKAFIPCERKLSDDVLRYFHGCIDSIQSLGRKITMIYFQCLERKHLNPS